MDYTKIIIDNVNENELLHKVTQDITAKFTNISKLTAQGEHVAAAELLGTVDREIELLNAIDTKINGNKKSVTIA